jgi:(R,R)-butanediol dehydrogenase/meso-butanediol dehydrogenase/diacetyl reductase/L-iditol 2-dehydrogenase
MYDIPEVQITKPDDVKIKVAYAGICGSDIHIIHGDIDEFIGVKPGDKRVIGHEAVGYVAELGPATGVKGLKVGDKVAFYYNYHCGNCYYCRSGKEGFCENIELRDWVMSDYIVFSEQQVYKLPDDADMKRAALIEPVSVTLHGVDLCNIKPAMTVMISGSGGIGLLLLQEAKLCGATRLTVSEPVAEKRENALKLGADYVIDPFSEDVAERSMEITDGRGFDVIIEASGNPKSIAGCYHALGRGGTLQFFGTYPEGTFMKDIPLDGMKALAFKEAKLIGIFQSPYMFHRAVEFYEKLDLDLFTQYVFKPEDCKLAFETQMTGKPQKVLFDFN